MMLVLITSLILLATPDLPEAPPPRAKSTPVAFTFADGTVITTPDDAQIHINVVKTPDGNRIRLTIDRVTINTTHVKIVVLKHLTRQTTEMRIDKDGMIESTTVTDPRDPLPMRPLTPVKP
jgi:hypothetical protein